MSATKWKHDDLQADLAKHLRRNSDCMVWEDMQLGPVGSPRPDCYRLMKSYTKFCPIVYEIKISVADFRSDITSGKWQKYLNFAGAVVFAVPSGLISKKDLPHGCGLMVRGDEGWSTIKGPTLHPVDSLPREAWMKLLIDGIDRQFHSPELRPTPNSYRVAKEVSKRFGERVGSLLGDVCDAERNLEYQLERLQKESGEVRIRADAEIAAARERAGTIVDAANAELLKLASDLGIDTNNRHVIVRRIAELREDLSRDVMIANLRQRLESVARIAGGGHR